MSSIRRVRPSCAGNGASRSLPAEPKGSAARIALRLTAVALAAAALAACSQHAAVNNKPASVAATQQVPPEPARKASIVVHRHVATVTKKHTPFATAKRAAEPQDASHGIASFYTEGTQTANGEKFNTMEMTAAHPTLPFGTKLRVTDVASGKSVTVRVNDRGPYVPGRVVDVSYSAANALGIVGKGVANVKLDVVQ